jgi:tripartite-type tricarboxylate transporter receptor subunit TctC
MKFSRLALATVMLALSATAMRADDYPSRPVHVIVPYTPGASTDLLARAPRISPRRNTASPS